MPLAVGQILNNRYRIEQVLGQGGFGAVYRAVDLNLSYVCAIKENLATTPDAQRQFMREATILANLSHPNLPRVTDYFLVPNQGQYLVMDFIDGEDLDTLVHRQGPVLVGQALAWITQIADALIYLHGQHPPVLHRDIKPANIRVTLDGRAVLVDFGLVKVFDPNQRTTMGARAVTPGFAPPEQYGHGLTDERTDIYALGATLYMALTGREPVESVQRIGTDPLPPAHQMNPMVTRELSLTITRAMCIDPLQRFQRVSDFKIALFPVVQVPSMVTTWSGSPPAQSASGYQQISVKNLPDQSIHVQNISWKNILLVLSALLIIVIVILVIQVRNRDASNRTATQRAIARVTRSARLTNTSLPGTPAATLPASSPLPISPTPFIQSSTPLPTPIVPPQSSPSPTPKPDILSNQVSPKDGMVLVYIPAGQFLMGSSNADPSLYPDEKPQHKVFLDAFWIDLTEVTNAMFAKFVAATNYQTDAEKIGWGWVYTDSTVDGRIEVNGADWQHPSGPSSSIASLDVHPVVQVSWNDAKAYCKWAGRRLPTEAEWEKAARGTEGRIYPWGAGIDCNRANYRSTKGFCVGSTTEVGSYPKSASIYGVLDMAGNVWQWVADYYDENYYANSPANNPKGPSPSTYVVLRGGSWYNLARDLRSANRWSNTPEERYDRYGFRCSADYHN